MVRVLSQLWHRIQVGSTRGGVIGQSDQPIVAQDSGRENRELLVRVLSQLWHRIQVNRELLVRVLSQLLHRIQVGED